VPALRAIATAAPERTLQSADAARLDAQLTRATERRARSISALYAASGVETRAVACGAPGDHWLYEQDDPRGPTTAERLGAYDAAAPPIAERAARDALDRAGVAADTITHLVTASCTGMSAPGLDYELIQRLGLPTGAQRTNIGFMGCHAAVNALRVAAALASADPSARVLVCCAELCSLHFQHARRAGSATANALFGDAAAACVVDSSSAAPQLAAFASNIFPDTRDLMAWRIGDHGFEMTLSPKTPDAVRAAARHWVPNWLEEHDLSTRDIAAWAIHPGGPRVLDAALEGLDLAPEKEARARDTATHVLRTRGNTSSPTILLILERILAAGPPEGPIAALAFGPGLAAEAFVLSPP